MDQWSLNFKTQKKVGKSSQVSGKYSSPQKNCPNQKSKINLIFEGGNRLGIKDKNQGLLSLIYIGNVY